MPSVAARGAAGVAWRCLKVSPASKRTQQPVSAREAERASDWQRAARERGRGCSGSETERQSWRVHATHLLTRKMAAAHLNELQCSGTGCRPFASHACTSSRCPADSRTAPAIREELAQLPSSVGAESDIAAPRAFPTSAANQLECTLSSGNLRARGTKPRRSWGESIPLDRMVAVSRAGDAPGTAGMGATALESSRPVVRGCFAGASQPRRLGGPCACA